MAAARRISGLPMSGRVLDRQDDSLVLLDLGNLIDRYSFLQRGWENKGVRELTQVARTFGSTVFLDVGAGLGTYTLAMARLPAIHTVHSFEPDPTNRAQLYGNLWLNGLEREVTVHGAAVSDGDGETSFYLARKPDHWERSLANYGTSSLGFLRLRHRAEDAIDVRTTALDALDLPARSDLALKVDVEGNEAAVVEGARGLFASARSVVLMLEVFARSQERVFPLLESIGLVRARQVGRENYIYVREPSR